MVSYSIGNLKRKMLLDCECKGKIGDKTFLIDFYGEIQLMMCKEHSIERLNKEIDYIGRTIEEIKKN